MNARILNAVNMFYESPTGRQLRGDDKIKTLAKRVVPRLKVAFRHNDISFGKLPDTPEEFVAGISRDFWHPWFMDDIVISKRLVNDLAATSLTLVHEAAHLELKLPYIEEELWCRALSIHYL